MLRETSPGGGHRVGLRPYNACTCFCASSHGLACVLACAHVHAAQVLAVLVCAGLGALRGGGECSEPKGTERSFCLRRRMCTPWDGYALCQGVRQGVRTLFSDHAGGAAEAAGCAGWRSWRPHAVRVRATRSLRLAGAGKPKMG